MHDQTLAGLPTGINPRKISLLEITIAELLSLTVHGYEVTIVPLAH